MILRYHLRYHLSSRQRKSLDRGSAVTIAIPAPWWETTAERHVRESLDVPAEWVLFVEERHLTVQPVDGGDGLAGTLGRILRREQMEAVVLSLEVLCYVAVLCRRDAPTSTLPTQWPGSVQTTEETQS